jgi:3-oxoacyl-[acyl-carrier protein] reductase
MAEAAPLAGKVAIVTGAGRGIGRCIALTLARAGAAVALAARTQGELEAVGAEIEAAGETAACFPTDIRIEADVIALLERTVQRFGRLDILVNNAGVGIFKPLVETTAGEWDQIMAANARGPFLLCRAAVPTLRRQPRSTIINIASVVAVKGYANQAAYAASKHALYGMSKALAREVQADGIRVHVISPGGVDTELSAVARPDLDRAGLMQPQEIADIVLFLATREGNAVIDEVNVRRESAMPWP